MVISVVGFMSLGVGGVGSAFQKYVAEAFETRDFRLASQRLSNGAVMMLVLGIAILIPVGFFPDWVADIMRVSPHFRDTFLASVRLLAATMIFTNFGMVYGSIVMGVHRIDLTRIVDLFCTTLEAALNVILLLTGHGIVGLVISYAVMEVTRLTLYFALSRRIIPEIVVSPRMLSRAEIRETLRFAGGYQIFSYLQVAYNALLPAVINRAFGEEITGVYGICRRLIGFPAIISESALLPLLSGATLVYARRELERFQRLFMRVVKFTLVALVPALVFCSVFSQATFVAMAKSPHALVFWAMILLSLAVLFGALSRVYAAMYRATGGGSRDIFWTVLKIVIFLGCWRLLKIPLGFQGALITFLVAELAGWIYMDVAMAHVIGKDSLASTALETARVLAPAVVVGLLCLPVQWIPLPEALGARWTAVLHLALAGSLYLAVGGLGLTLTGFLSRDEREFLGAYIPLFRNRDATSV